MRVTVTYNSPIDGKETRQYNSVETFCHDYPRFDFLVRKNREVRMTLVDYDDPSEFSVHVEPLKPHK